VNIETMFNVVKTDHLILRHFQQDDVGPLYEIQSNPDWMQYTFCSKSLNESKERLNIYASQYDQLGYAPWTILTKLDCKIIGWGGLNIDPYNPGWGTEVAYFFHPTYWGQGFATELVQAALDHGFTNLGLSEINAYTHRDNIASIRVLEKCGFKFIQPVPKLDRNHYEIVTKLPRATQ
jgi:ribosomal-protein-alanine N-acetyltransferase